MKRIHFLLLLILFWVARNTILVRQRDTGSFAAVDSMALLQVASIFLLFGSFLFFYPKLSFRTVKNIVKSPVLWFFLLYILGLISALWSPLFNYSVYRAFESLVLFFAIFIYFNYMLNDTNIERRFLRFILILLLFTFLGQLKLHGFSISIESLHTNSYSFVALILFLYCIGEIVSKSNKTLKRKKMLKKYAWAGLLFVVLGTSAATNISLIIGLATLALLTNRNDFRIAFIAFLLVVAPLFILMGDMDTIQEILFPGKSVESITTMTGRMNLWDQYIMMIYERPYFGWGFAVIARIAEHATTNTHNSILSILSGMGFFGGMIFLIFLIRSLISVFINRKHKNIGTIGSGIALIAALANSMSIAVIGESASPATLSFVALISFYYLRVAGRNINQDMHKES
ncbi:O-antigen ligase family protein [Sulfurovum riftiae]|uniref:O-antigen ligase-related domain-containing protein n=1 Tax=Sulfurovum riftiae TaxID=1630136 RepID=A0A151CDG7_9BACT|nr:O-antigen ligase family protein [Sulfurovum riftiae]KYJ85564.1 hypothetical protein AS592_00535 [Sulfurovum riftiae]